MVKLFFGPNAYKIKIALDALVSDAEKQFGPHAVEKIDGEALEAGHVPDVLQGATLFAPERLVIIKNAGKNKPVWEAIGEKVPDVPESVRLILVESAPDKRTKTFKALQKYAEVTECKELDEREAAKWLVEEAKNRGGQIEKTDAETVVERAGADQSRLSNELDKLLLYGEISNETIEKLVEQTPQANVFALLDAAMNGKPEAVKKLLNTAKITEDPYQLFGLLSSQILQLAALVHGNGRSSADVAKELGVHPFPLQKLSLVAKKTSPAQLRYIVEVVSDLDDQMKSTGVEPWQLIENALIKISNRG